MLRDSAFTLRDSALFVMPGLDPGIPTGTVEACIA